jgi:hypothetical protein
VKQESHFVWSNVATNDRLYRVCGTGPAITENEYSAFTVAELGEMLPVFVDGLPLGISADRTGIYTRYDNGSMKVSFEADTEADARAKMLIHLIENKLLSA